MALVVIHLVTEMSTKNILGSRERPVRKAVNLTQYMSRLYKQRGILSILQPHRLQRPIIGVDLLF
jgi:hypothetical protein